MGSIPEAASLSDETLNRCTMTIFKNKRLTRTYCDEAGDSAVSNVFSPRYLVVFRHDLLDIQCKLDHPLVWQKGKIVLPSEFHFGLPCSDRRIRE